MTALLTALHTHFGFHELRPNQTEIISDTLAGHDVLAVLPTGAGKSLCYQLPALIDRRLTLVVSPLIALMKDQVDGLRARGIATTFLNSTLHPSEAELHMRALDRGALRLLYIAPEGLLRPALQERLKNWRIARIAVDEAHCISEWGHEFRPEYCRLAELRSVLPEATWIALTATATARVRAEIAQRLKLNAPRIHLTSFNRANLRYQVHMQTSDMRSICRWISERHGESGIVYVQRRQSAEEFALALSALGVTALPYHASLSAQARERHQDAFLCGETRVICATTAFGMGIDKADVRYVVHADLPASLEAYYQETGRAGRDGGPAECALFFRYSDAIKRRHAIQCGTQPKQRSGALRRLRAMTEYAYATDCRRRNLLGYFGERYLPGSCQACDRC